MAPSLPSSSPFPDMRVSGVSFPDSPITIAAFAYARERTTEAVYNHCVRSAYWALILAKKLDFSPLLLKTAAQAENNKNNKNGKDSKKENFTVQAAGGTRELDLEVVVLACVLHDMGWATNKELLSTCKRFEVDGADLARGFLERYVKDGGQGAEDWGPERVQRVWYAIALHTSRSIAPFGSLEVATAHLGITADFTGPAFPANPWGDPSSSSSLSTQSSANPSNPTTNAIGPVITVEEFKEVMRAFPYAGFGEQGVKNILCGLCRDKPATTVDNLVGNFGGELGLDGQGKDREADENSWLKVSAAANLTANFAFLESLLKEE